MSYLLQQQAFPQIWGRAATAILLTIEYEAQARPMKDQTFAQDLESTNENRSETQQSLRNPPFLRICSSYSPS